MSIIVKGDEVKANNIAEAIHETAYAFKI
jgi:hypothetical protein